MNMYLAPAKAGYIIRRSKPSFYARDLGGRRSEKSLFSDWNCISTEFRFEDTGVGSHDAEIGITIDAAQQ